MGTMPQSKSVPQSPGLQTTLFNVDRLSSPRRAEPVATSVRRMGIICEIGPSSKHLSTLTNMIENGMTIAKIFLNEKFSDFCCNKTILDLQKAVADYSSRLGVSVPVAIAVEITPHIRPGTLKNLSDASSMESLEGRSFCHSLLKRFILNQLQWGKQLNIDMIFASLTETSEIQDLRNVNNKKGNYLKRLKIFANIENIAGLKNFNEILQAADGIVLVRDELSKCIPPQDMFFVQKAIVSQCNEEGKPVVITGEVLESMVKNPQPSRYDCLDISTLVLDGADCVELTSATTDGRYPEEAVASLSTVCRAAEAAIQYDQIFLERSNEVVEPVEAIHASATAAVKAAISSRAKIIVCLTSTCKPACLLSRYSPPCPVIVVTRDPGVAKECLVYRGLLPIIQEAEVSPESDWMLDVEGDVKYAIKYGMALNILQRKDTIIVLSEGNETHPVRLTVETVDQYIDSANNETQSVNGAAGVIG